MTTRRATAPRRLLGAFAWLLAGIVLALGFLGASPRAHALLHDHADDAHHAAAHDDAGCAVTLFQHGVTTPIAMPQVEAPASVWIDTLAPAPVAAPRSAPDLRLMPSRGPPRLA